MTENKAINGWTFEETVKTTENLMEAEKNIFKWDVLRHLRDFAENYKEELEQYRAIGTVEDIEKGIKQSEEEFNMLMEYRAIGTIDEFKALKEKSVAKKVAYQGEHEKCPNCGSFHVFGKHCTECGQKIDWSE